jgi:response regulator RpfG family c-di-GMP phosphodiesterase
MFSLITPSISIGIATKTKEIESMDQILVEAEKEMYFNKQTDGKITRKEFLENLSARLHKIHPDLGSHSSRMAKKAKEFAKYLKLKSDDLDTLIKLATYHDIGWIGIDDYLLLKTDQITDAETEKIRQHPGIGFRIMKSIPELAYLSDLVISHHERWDGTGFPENLQGEDIPYLSRVLYILDAFDMMTNVSVFMETRSLEDALNELNLYAGTQFDPKIVDLFIQMHKKTI